MKLPGRAIEKPWGQLGVACGDCRPQARIGEVCFEHPERDDQLVLVKYLYTSERLSIQVHPNNQQARDRGHASGKDEMWIVLEAEPNARIGLGLTHQCSEDEIAAAIASGTIEELVDWRAVSQGDVIYNAAGTIHAAGAGLVLLEVQQAIDLTYRLYDYGRPRDLHLEDGLAVAAGRPHDSSRDCSVADGRSRLLVDGPYFGAVWCAGSLPAGIPAGVRDCQIVVIEGSLDIGGVTVEAGECCLVRSLDRLHLPDDCIAVLAWPTAEALAAAA